MQTVLVTVVVALAGLLSNLLAGYQPLSNWLNGQSWYSQRNLLLALAAAIVPSIALVIWQRFSSSDDGDTATREDLDAATRKILEGFYDAARKEGRIPPQELKAKEEEITRLTGELRKLQQQLAARSSEPPEAELSSLLKAGDLDAALRLKSQQVQARRKESGKLPRDLYELGTIHELRFEWPQALAAYREAWELGRDPDHGFKYAHFAQKLNHFNEAIDAYEALLRIYTDPPDRAKTLNNITALYRATQRLQKAEEAYGEVLAIHRKLAEANPDAYLPDVATTLNNLAHFDHSAGRTQEAETNASESERIIDPLWQANPELHGNRMARILFTRAEACEATKQPAAEACALARRALAAAYDPALKQSIQQLIDRLCPESQG